jgi:hypothetical protein
MPDGGGRCHFDMAPAMPGHCDLRVRHETKDPEFVTPWFTERSVSCGDSVDVCGTLVKCECERRPAQWPCGDAGSRGMHNMRMHFLDGGADCFVYLDRPGNGNCRASVRYSGAVGREEGFVDIPFNESRRICRGAVEQRCACDDFAERCSFDIKPSANGRCEVMSRTCNPLRCEDLGMWLYLGETGFACGQPVRCAEEGRDGGR